MASRSSSDLVPLPERRDSKSPSRCGPIRAEQRLFSSPRLISLRQRSSVAILLLSFGSRYQTGKCTG
ncbi:hypothetical protein EYF80_020650 [Liparis tanakae]|uniref:Uncharacterized protein n=1 Tax=Liparis tanakae TaxID=230148 RepID=A0A4Z2HW39_9TELE|nr:hypothetical protein EYF80_020650 [Liparis tanakae]